MTVQPDEDSVLLQVDSDGVALITLNRPERRNSWTPRMEARYFEVLERADCDPAVRVAILTGAGSTFCPGVDAGRLDAIAGQPFDVSGRRSPVRAWAFRKPLIAAINGACAGMGLVQALLCDVRFAASGVRFTTAFSRRGLVGEYGITWLLPRLIGIGDATDLLLSGRVFDADEALGMGVVNRVDAPDRLLAAATEYARDIARNCSPRSLAFLRHQLHTDPGGSFEATLRSAYHAMDAAAVSADFREGMDSYLQKRPPQFPPLSDDCVPGKITGRPVPEVDLNPAQVLGRPSTT
jgi:enoyl-CoA hydratase/carnithine racemase